MREVTLKVENKKTPKATEVDKLERKSLVKLYLYRSPINRFQGTFGTDLRDSIE